MPWKKCDLHRVQCYPCFRASTGGLGTYPCGHGGTAIYRPAKNQLFKRTFLMMLLSCANLGQHSIRLRMEFRQLCPLSSPISHPPSLCTTRLASSSFLRRDKHLPALSLVCAVPWPPLPHASSFRHGRAEPLYARALYARARGDAVATWPAQNQPPRGLPRAALSPSLA